MNRHRVAGVAVFIAVLGSSLTASALPAFAEERPARRDGHAGTADGEAGMEEHRRRRPPARRIMAHSIKGEVTQVGQDSFTLKTRRGAIQVKTNDRTRFRGGTEADLSVGDKVGVVPACKRGKPADGQRSCIKRGEGTRTVNARAVLFPPGGSFGKDPVPTSESGFSA